MYYETKLKITMKSESSANLAKAAIANALRGGNFDEMYRGCPSEMLISDLTVNSNLLLIDKVEGYYIPEDIMDVLEAAARAIAAAVKDECFEMTSWTTSTYSECSFDASFSNGTLNTESVYYPYGYGATLACEECGDYELSIEDFDPNKTYICPECGAEVNFAEQYESTKPDVCKKTFEIK